MRTECEKTVTNNFGSLYFFVQVTSLNFDIDLKSYFDNAELFRNITIRLIDECHKIPNETQCEVYEQKYKLELAHSDQVVEYGKADHRLRSRRWLLIVGNVLRPNTATCFARHRS